MRFAIKVFFVVVVGVGLACAAQPSYAQDARTRGLIYLTTVVVGAMWGTKAAEAQQKEAEEKRRAEEAKRRAEEEAKAKAERDEADRRLRALEAFASAARAAEEAKARAEKEAADRRYRALVESLTRPPPPSPSPPPLTGAAKIYSLGAGWPTSAKHCISFVAGVCSPCDYHFRLGDADTCDIRLGERILVSDAIK
jgi:Skp family chaperone for outer membrane proteins